MEERAGEWCVQVSAVEGGCYKGWQRRWHVSRDTRRWCAFALAPFFGG